MEVRENEKQPEDPTGVREYFKEPILSPNAARVHLPLYDTNIIAKNYAHLDIPTSESGNDTKTPSEPKQKTFDERVEETRKRLEADSKSWKANQDFITRMMPENDWRDIPGFSQYEMNRLGTVRGKKSKVERPLYVKLWRGGDTEVVIGKDALKEMTFGVKDG